MSARLSSAAKTDVGLKRTNNEDNYIVVPSHGLYVLADGMGGHASGQVASSMCVSHVAKFICEICRQPGFELPYKANPGISREANLLVNAIKYANERVYIQSCKERSMEGMGTTVTAIYNAPHGLVLAHVGDSRIYRIRNGQITQMSRDHSLLNHLLDTGELKPEDAAGFANKNVILRAIGLKENVDVDVKEVPREKGDIYMMCSDGLSDIVSEAQIVQAITSGSPNLNEACNRLIALALKAGGKDNVTVVCVSVDQEDQASAVPPQGGLRPSVPGSLPSMAGLGPISGGAPMAPSPISGGMPGGAQNRSQSQPMMSRAPSYGTGMSAVTMPISKPMNSFGNMVPVPGRAMPAMQPQQPVRMHSVREVVEKVPAVRSMPKPVGSAGRSGSAGMPMIPIGAKTRPKNDQKTENEQIFRSEQQARGEFLPKPELAGMEDVAPDDATLDVACPEEEVCKPTVIDNPVFIDSAKTVVKDVSRLSQEEIAARPETGLLFTEPPTGATGSEAAGSAELEYEDEDEDEDKTLVQRSAPAFVTERLASGILHESAPTGLFRSPDSRPFEDSAGQGMVRPVIMSSAEVESVYESDGESEAKKNAVVRRGYVPPKDVVLPPHHDYDEDDDNIEIAGVLFGEDGDEEDVTRQFRKPPMNFKKW